MAEPRHRGRTVFLAVAASLAVANLLFHLRFPHLLRENDRAGTTLSLAAIVMALLLVASAPRASGLRWPAFFRELGWQGLVVLALSIGFHLRHVAERPPSADELLWLRQARWILEGTNSFHPFGTIGDQPANFQAWPVAILLAILRVPLLSVRLTGAIYLLAAALLLARLCRLAGGRSAALLALLFGGLSLWSVHLATIGYNNVTIVPLLVVAQLVTFLEAVSDRCERALLWNAVAVGFSVATLYVPLLLVPLISTGVLLQRRALGRRGRIEWLLVLFLIASPTIGKCIRFPSVLGLHVKAMTAESGSATNVASFGVSASQLARSLTPENPPRPSRLAHAGLWGIFVEPTTWCFAVFGLVFLVAAIVRGRAGLAERWVLFATLWMCAAIFATRPAFSPWRYSGLQPFLVTVAALGAARALAAFKETAARASTGALALLAVIHFSVFFSLYSGWRSSSFDTSRMGLHNAVSLVTPQVIALHRRGYTIAVPRRVGPAFQTSSSEPLPVIEYDRPESAVSASRGGPLAIIVFVEVEVRPDQVPALLRPYDPDLTVIPVHDARRQLRALIVRLFDRR